MARTIQSPGVEINEIDLSLRPDLPVGTNILIPGFSPAGPVDEVLQVASLSEFEQVYGLPTNATERYFYHTVRAAFQSPGNIYVTRLPYGADRGDTIATKHYSALLYPCTAQVKTPSADGTTYTENQIVPLSGLYDLFSDPNHTEVDVKMNVLEPIYVELTQDEYQHIIDGNIDWKGHDNVGHQPYTVIKEGDAGYPEKGANETDEAFKERKRLFDVDQKMQLISHAGVVVLNDRSLTVNEKFEGYYVGLADSDEFYPGSDYKSIVNISTINKNSKLGETANESFRSIPTSRLSFPLQSTSDETPTYTEGSISEVMENMPSNDISTQEFSDILVLGVFKLRKSSLDPDTEKLSYALSEYHIGSLNANREQFDPNGGAPISYALSDITSNSPNFTLLVNKHIAQSGDIINRNEEAVALPATLSGETPEPPIAKSRLSMVITEQAKQLYAHGVYKQVSEVKSTVGAIPSKLDRVFELIDNHELFPLDITLEAGLGTIFAATYGGTSEDNYDDEDFFDLNKGVSPVQAAAGHTVDSYDPQTSPNGVWNYEAQGNSLYSTGQKQFLGGPVMWYRNVANRFVEFAEKKRKDHMCILDPLRHIFIQGVNGTVLSDKSKNFSQHVYWPLRHLYQSINTSYGAVYGNWAKTFDGQLGRNVWVPMSGYLAATYANTDANFQPWFAPAGFTRGVLNGIADIAIYPKQKHRDQLYKINVNPIANFPNDGFTIFGQKTLQAKPSAFDRVNVRRLFLYLEKATRATAKYFIFEPNTLFTRTQVSNVLAPIFDRAKNTQGLYDYLLICDERNNTPDVIDQNEMVIDIYIKPVRAAEFILVNFYATRTGQDFSELVS